MMDDGKGPIKKIDAWKVLPVFSLCLAALIITYFFDPTKAWATVLSNRESGADPKPGQSFSAVKALAPANAGRSVLIAYVGECTGCSMNTIDFRTLKWPESMEVLLVFSSRPSKEVKDDLGKRCRIVVDDKGDIAKLVNPVFLPRAVLLDSEMRVVWVSQRPGELPTGVS